jgi:PAS domain S-box-containing protein
MLRKGYNLTQSSRMRPLRLRFNHRVAWFNVLGYVASASLWSLAYGSRFALVGILPEQGFPFLTFFPAVMLAAYFFGLGPGLLCAGLSVAGAYASFIPHSADNFTGLEKGDLIALIFFSSVLLVDCIVLHLLRRSRSLAAERERDLRELTANSPDVLTRFDHDFRHLFVSGAIERLTGRPTSDFIGKTNRELGMPPKLCDIWENALASVFRDTRPVSLRFEYDGAVFAASLVPEFNDDRVSVRSVVGVTRDISEIDRHERALMAHDERKDQMLATVAHELRNPLTTFTTGVCLLERLADPPQAVGRTIAAMRRQTTQMSRLVEDLMDLNRIRSNALDLNRTAIDLKAILQATQEASFELARRKSINIELRLLEESMPLEGDAGRLIQVFSNVVTNAIKFSEVGGEVVVEAKRENDAYKVSVTDQGAGIEPDMLDAVFEPFVQAPAGRIQQSGLGIGLALVKQILKMHAGNVTAVSQGLGKGSTFIVRLPAPAPSPTVMTVAPTIVHAASRANFHQETGSHGRAA